MPSALRGLQIYKYQQLFLQIIFKSKFSFLDKNQTWNRGFAKPYIRRTVVVRVWPDLIVLNPVVTLQFATSPLIFFYCCGALGIMRPYRQSTHDFNLLDSIILLKKEEKGNTANFRVHNKLHWNMWTIA